METDDERPRDPLDAALTYLRACEAEAGYEEAVLYVQQERVRQARAKEQRAREALHRRAVVIRPITGSDYHHAPQSP